MKRTNRNRSRLGEMADATPAGRDRYVDLLRAFSILVVVIGHWLMAIIYFDDKGISGSNALDVVPGLWLITWFLQVMPLFFLVGGFSNLVSWRSAKEKRLTYGDFLYSRINRLMRPTGIFIAIWTVVAIGVRLLSPASFDQLGIATALLAKPLWFLAVYVLVVALAPAMLKVHDRFGGLALLTMGLAAVLVDVIRIGLGVTWIGYLNFAFVWLFAHQLGFFYADGTLTRLSRKVLAAAAAGSLALLAVLTGSGIYSPSMVGMETDAASNNSPPSVCLVILTIWLTSAAMLIRPAATRWLQRRKAWTAVIAANSMIMTIFLWHLTAALVAVVVLFPLGFPQPRGGSAVWWAWRPMWLAVLAITLSGFVTIFGRFERPTRRTTNGPLQVSSAAVTAGVVALVMGLAGLAQFGFASSSLEIAQLPTQPLIHAALVAVGYRALTFRSPVIGGR